MAAGQFKNFTLQDFEQQALQKPGTWIVDFGAPWCAPCRALTPALSDIAATSAGRVDVAEVNVDEEEELAARFQVTSVPTLLLFHDGKLVDRRVGAAPKSTLSKWIQEALA